MPDGKRLALLLESLRSHDISFNQNDLQKALETQSEEAVETWIDEHLGPETLLTREEFSLYSVLRKSGESEVLTASQDISLISGIGENDIRSAIEQLQKSNLVIEKQTQTLRVQQEAVATLVKASGQSHDARTEAENLLYAAWTAERNKTKSTVDELLQTVKYQVDELAGLCKTADIGLRKTASEILRVDDKLLLGLQKLASDIDPGNQEEDGTANQIRNLCARLIKHTVEGVRTRLDRIYLEEVIGSEDVLRDTKASENAEVVALLDELESLYTEILPVSQISVEQQYLEPALRLIASHNTHGTNRSTKAIEYISKCLSDLIGRLRDFNVQVEEYRSYRTATAVMANAFESEFDVDRSTSPRMRQPGSPTRLRKHSKPLSPIRPRSTRRRSSATSFDDDVNPELQILRNLGISLPPEPSCERQIAVALQEILVDRAAKLNGHAKSLRDVSEATISSHLHDSQVTLQSLKDSLFSETHYKSVTLNNKEVHQWMSKLEKGVEEVKKKTGAINLEPLRERNARRDDLVDKWGR